MSCAPARRAERLGLKFELTRRGAIRAIYPGKAAGGRRARVVSHLDTSARR
jgi:putative aminopeptidase FrvX